MKNQNTVNVKVTSELRDKLIHKRYQLKLDGIGTLIQKMYDMMNKLKLWDELK